VRGAENAGKPAYFPLGARFEFKHVTPPEIRRASQRELLFNFVGTLGTSPSRKRMMQSIKSLNTSSTSAILGRGFFQTPERWSGNPNSGKAQKGGYLEVDEYRAVLLKSVLTLAPAGHNPECFRLWEALEAGSIPVVPLGEAYHQHPCTDTLLPLRQSAAPIIFVRGWTELPDILKDLNDHPTRADQMQKEALAWYERFMRDTAARFEATLDARLAAKQQKQGAAVLAGLTAPTISTIQTRLMKPGRGLGNIGNTRNGTGIIAQSTELPQGRRDAGRIPLITGCGRSGSKSLAEYLKTAGIAAVHEGVRQDSVSVSWLYAADVSLVPHFFSVFLFFPLHSFFWSVCR